MEIQSKNPSIQVTSELLLYGDHIYLISIFRAQCFSPEEHPLKRILLCFQKFGFFTAQKTGFLFPWKHQIVHPDFPHNLPLAYTQNNKQHPHPQNNCPVSNPVLWEAVFYLYLQSNFFCSLRIVLFYPKNILSTVNKRIKIHTYLFISDSPPLLLN